MKRLRLGLTFSLFLTFSATVFAQDIHFSQFYMSPLNLNPAMTGVMNCNHRLVANYRNQWASILKANAFSTYSVSYDNRSPVGRYDYFGFGGVFWGDKAGELDFATLSGKLSFSYSKRMGGYRNRASYLVVGVDGGISQRSIDFLKAKWGLQAQNGQHDPGLPTGEENKVYQDQFIFADLAAGILWFSVLDENNSLYFGGAYHHLNRANQSFDEAGDVPLYSKYTIHAGGEFRLSSKFGLVPGAVVFLQGPSMQVNSGFNMRFFLGNNRLSNKAFQVGGWVRIANKDEGTQVENPESGVLVDAAIISTRFEYESFGIGFSYDINVSSLRPASNSNGAFEFSLNYKICGPERRNVYCPNF